MTSRDQDDLSRFKRALDAATPAPDEARRAETLARAMEVFDRTQGSTDAARHIPATPKHRGFFAGVLTMLWTRTTGVATAATAIAAVGVLILIPQVQDGTPGRTTPPPVGLTAEPLPADDDGTFPMRPRILREPFVPEAAEVPLEPGPETEGPAFTEIAPQPTPVTPVPSQDAAPEERGSAGAPALAAPLSIPAAPADQAAAAAIAPAPSPSPARIQQGLALDTPPPLPPQTEAFANAAAGPLRLVAEEPVSTFSIDVDTAAYSLLRSTLNRGQLPDPNAIRIEEMVNYFPYDYPAPDPGDASPFRASVEVFQTPWNPDTQLVHIGLQGLRPAIENRPPLNLVFLIDTSGSMDDPAKLPLLIQSFRLMLDRLTPADEVAIVTYAGSAGVALEPTPASDTATIGRALTALQAGGATNGVGGLQVAYDLAADMTGEGEVSRVLLATDGDFNVGISNPSALEDYIAGQRETGIYLSVLGFGRGNLQDATMQALAQSGNGTAAYIDTLHEAQRVLVDQLAGALFPIADDVKVQVEFNPALIAEYRLIGYETRALEREDFANDAVDAGELGAGHSVTAIYEVTPVGSPALRVPPLRYTAEAEAPPIRAEYAEELGFLSLRWKAPGEEASQLIEVPIPAALTQPGTEAQFAAAIAGFGQLLRGSEFTGDWNYADAIALANANRGADEFGYRAEAVQLMRLAQGLSD